MTPKLYEEGEDEDDADDSQLDSSPLTFGKFRGRTPIELFDAGEFSYLVWMCKNVDKFPTCSRVLAMAAAVKLGKKSSTASSPRPVTPTPPTRSSYNNKDHGAPPIFRPIDSFDTADIEVLVKEIK